MEYNCEMLYSQTYKVNKDFVFNTSINTLLNYPTGGINLYAHKANFTKSVILCK